MGIQIIFWAKSEELHYISGLSCMLSDSVYSFLHSGRKQLQEERRNVLFTLSSKMDDDQMFGVLPQQMSVCGFKPHQSEEGLKSISLASWVSILTTKTLYTKGLFSPDMFFFFKTKASIKKNKSQFINERTFVDIYSKI